MSSEFVCLMKLINQINGKKSKNIKKQSDSLEFLFRGHAKKSYLLKPLVYRVDKKSENDIFSYIMTKHSNEFIGMNPLEVLAKMQHLGVATRLLDVTKNPLVGLFFAVDSIKPSEKKDESKATLNNESDNEKKESITEYTKAESANDNTDNKPEDAELIVFNCPNRDIKSYYSDTIKLLSCLPFLNEERQKQLLFDAVNEYLIDVSIKKLFMQLSSCVIFEKELQEIISFIKKVYYLDCEYKNKNGYLYVLEKLGKIIDKDLRDGKWTEIPSDNEIRIKYRVKQNDETYSYGSFDLTKYDFEIEFNSLYSFDEKTQIKYHLNFVIRFDSVDDSGVIYKIVSCSLKSDKTKKISDFDKFFYSLPYNKEKGYESLFSTFSKNGGYLSKAMEELHYRVKGYCPDFRYCARPLDIINGVYVYPLVNTDRMRAQQGLFAIYGLSQYWNIQRYLEYQKSKVSFFNAMKQFLENNVKAVEQIRDMEDTIYGINRIPIYSEKVSELKSALKKLGVDKETLGCSMETTYLNFTNK